MIESPNFPRPYPHLRDCLWTITAPRGNTVNVTFSHFDVEDPSYYRNNTCVYDFVEVVEGRYVSNMVRFLDSVPLVGLIWIQRSGLLSK